MRTVYLPLEEKNKQGKFYTEFQSPDGLPLGEGIIYVEPDEKLKYPKYDWTKGLWVEDKDSIIEYMKTELEELKVRLSKLEA